MDWKLVLYMDFIEALHTRIKLIWTDGSLRVFYVDNAPVSRTITLTEGHKKIHVISLRGRGFHYADNYVGVPWFRIVHETPFEDKKKTPKKLWCSFFSCRSARLRAPSGAIFPLALPAAH